MTTRYAIDSLWYRTAGGLGVLAGAPMSYFGVTDAGARILDALESGADLPAGHESLTDRLCAAGAIHPLPPDTAATGDLTVVIPVFARTASDTGRVVRLVESLSPLRVVVVDDASPVSVADAFTNAGGDSIPGNAIPGNAIPTSNAIPTNNRVSVVSLAVNGGPGTARNAGLERVSTPVVVFVDGDVDITPDAVVRLAAMVTTGAPVAGSCVAVAPRVAGGPGDSAIGEYERFHSPLDMGAAPALVKQNGRVPYVPSAVLACNTSVARTIGAFTGSMRTGEDVDFVWRLIAGGFACRYVPSIVALHAPRPSLGALVRQRVAYGSSAARLETAHPRSVAPFRAHPLVVVPGLALLGGFPLVVVPAALVVVAWLSFTMRRMPLGFTTTWKLAFFAMRNALDLLARAIRRSWWPAMVVIAPLWHPAALALTVSVLVPGVWDAARHAPSRTFAYMLLRVVDDVAYGAGLWIGAVRARSARCLLPVFSVRRSVAR